MHTPMHTIMPTTMQTLRQVLKHVRIKRASVSTEAEKIREKGGLPAPILL